MWSRHRRYREAHKGTSRWRRITSPTGGIVRRGGPGLIRKLYGTRLPRRFYSRDTLIVAKELLGCVLAHKTSSGSTAGMIVETEAYLENEDGASHARFGRTERSSIMFGEPGRSYVYFVYGMHYLFNAVTEPEGKAGAVLVRGLEPVEGVDIMIQRRGGNEDSLANGPARLCQALGIGREQNNLDLCSGQLGIYRGYAQADLEVDVTTRIGVAGSKDELYRFLIRGNPHVSSAPAGIKKRRGSN